MVDEDEQRMRAEAILQAMEERAAGLRSDTKPPTMGTGGCEEQQLEEDVGAVVAGTTTTATKDAVVVMPDRTVVVDLIDEEDSECKLEDSAAARSPLPPQPPVASQGEEEEIQYPRLGTVFELLEAANSEEKAFVGAHVLQVLKNVEWPNSDREEEKDQVEGKKEKDLPHAHPSSHPNDHLGLLLPEKPYESIITTMLESHFPKLPEEPVYDEDDDGLINLAGGPVTDNQNETDTEKPKGDDDSMQEDQGMAREGDSKKSKGEGIRESDDAPKRKSNVLDYPYPVDTWWPSTAGRRRERRHGGETSDEDAFEDPEDAKDSEPRCFRVNERKIVERLRTELEPGVLEKIPHCRIHRLKRKSAGPLAELVYCFQVTECYPGEMMVCCSVCGTWRHAACGGHYEPYSARKNIGEPFVPVCEQCHEEQRILKDHALAKARIERQRMEQLRRGLATTAVMRSMSFSKHGGTYKWPLGSVSATHVGGHTRSVQARHDKAEKQWADLLTRLGRGYGYRTKERQRVRTKELERLLVAIEDAEGQTDRHNMLLFLMRDTKKPMPAGFEKEYRNLFDPCYSDEEFDRLGYTPSIRRSENHKQKKQGAEEGNEGDVEDVKERPKCLRDGCPHQARFDSRFCSDGCGVHVLELDLLQAFYESNEIHPSVLRSHY